MTACVYTVTWTVRSVVVEGGLEWLAMTTVIPTQHVQVPGLSYSSITNKSMCKSRFWMSLFFLSYTGGVQSSAQKSDRNIGP